MTSNYKPGQVLTATDLNASFDAKTDNAAAAITGGSAEGLDHVYIIGSTDAINTQTGALVVTGGAAIGLQLQVGGKLTAGANAEVKSAAVSNDAVTGALIVAGGVGVGGSINSGGSIKAIGNLMGAMIIGTDGTNAVSPVTGALTTAGGAGIAKDLRVGGSAGVTGALSVQGNATVAGSVTAGSVVISPGGGITFGDGSTQTHAPIPEAPADGKKYGRKDVGWTVLTDIPEAPTDSKKYGRDNAAWVVLTDIPEAPADGKTYGRKNATWANTGGSTVDAEITLVDGAAANEVLPAWAPINFNTVTGAAFTKLDATSLLMNGDGPTTIQIAVDLMQMRGASVVFGYTIGTGAAVPIELGRIKLESDVKVRVKAQYNVLLHTNDHFHLWISSDIAYSAFAWSSGISNAFLNQTVGIPEAPINTNQYTRKGGQWVQVSASGMWRSDVPPTDTDRYPQWYNTNTSTLYVYYDDGDSAQWVICVPVPSTEEMTGAIWGQITGDITAQQDLVDYVAAHAGGGGGGSGLPVDGSGAMTGALVAIPGTAALPAINFGDPDTGLYSSSGSVNLSVNGSNRYLFGSSATINAPIRGASGTVAAPEYSFLAQTDLGFYRAGASDINFASNGLIVASLDSSNDQMTNFSVYPRTQGNGQVLVFSQPAGTADNQFGGFGMAVSELLLFVSKTGAASIPGIAYSAKYHHFYGPLQSDDGTVAAPQYSFNSEMGLGFYRYGAARMHLAAAGSVGFDFLNSATIAQFGITPRTANVQSRIAISNQPFLSANSNVLEISTLANGDTSIVSQAYGTATRGSLTIDAPNFYSAKNILVGSASIAGAVVVNKPTNTESTIPFQEAGVARWYWACSTNNYMNLARCDSSGNYAKTTISINWINDDVTLGNNLIVVTQGYKPGGGAWADSSDERIKENIIDYTHGLTEVLQLRPRTYTFKAETERDASIIYTGLIAQECEIAMPEMVKSASGKVGSLEFDDMRSLDSSALVYAMVNAIKELNAKVEALSAA